jgi:PAS domain S-box-containing protein
MNLNVNTLIVALSITNLMQVSVMFYQFRKNRTIQGPGWWAMGGLCAALGFALYEFRNFPSPYGLLAIVANNSLSLIALTIIYIGVKRFLGLHENKKALTVFCTVFVLLNIFFTIPHYDYMVRRTMLLAAVSIISILIGRCLFKYRNRLSSFWAKFLSTGFLIFGIICITGIVLTLTVKQLADANATKIMQTGMYTGVIFASTIWTFGFITLINQRLVAQSREASERFESLFNASPDGVFISSIADGIIWNINEGFTNLTGYTREETIGKTSLDINLYENIADRQYLFDEIAEKEICENFESVINKKDGTKITVLISAKKITLNGIPHDSCVMRDITERKIAEDKLKKSREQYHLLFENAVETVFVEQDTKLKLCNPIAETLTGYSTDELLTLPVSTFIHPDDMQFVIESHLTRAEDGNSVNQYDFRIVTKENEIKWVEIKSVLIKWNEDPATLNFITDISGRKQAVQDLMESEAKYRLITEFASDVIWVLNLDKNAYTYMSPSVCNLRGYTQDEAIKLGVEASFTPESMQIVRYSVIKNLEYFKKHPKASNYYTNELQQTCKNGDVIWVEESTKYRYNVDGEVEIVGVTRNIEDRKKTEAEILYLSYHDQLTGLKNRRYFDNSIKMLDEDKCIPLTLVMADVNGLKLTNDAFGHKAGDLILEKVAGILADSCGGSGIAARIGGDEFVLLLLALYA